MRTTGHQLLSASALALATTFALNCADPAADVAEEQGAAGLAVDETIPGLVMGLRHNLNQASSQTIMPSAMDFLAQHMEGGDIGAPRHRGYEWLQVKDRPGTDPGSVRLPPGVVVALKHSQNTRFVTASAFGHDPVTGPASFPGFVRQHGGDHGLPLGQGYFWYESTGEGFTDWGSVQNLPRMAVVGLKHTGSQRNKTFVWNGQVFDAGNPRGPVPAGFARQCGGDLGAPSGVGYCWFERTEGELWRGASIPTFQFHLPGSLWVAPGEEEHDADRDGLKDYGENLLAEVSKPFLRFDSLEVARRPDEPVTLFRVFRNPSRDWDVWKAITIRWVFLFDQDGGYTSGLCAGKNKHPGDNDTATWDLQSADGSTWYITRMRLGINKFNRSITWPGDSGRIEVFGLTHPVIYFSQGKHHEYFNRDRDDQDSFYSGSGPGDYFQCNDQVEGKGLRFLPDLTKLGPFHNVGEKDFQLIGDLGPIFPGQHAWGQTPFVGAGAGTNYNAFLNVLP